jgi:hypothetical protein
VFKELKKEQKESSLSLQKIAVGRDFESSTPNLGGWCSLRGNIRTKREPPLCKEFSSFCESTAKKYSEYRRGSEVVKRKEDFLGALIFLRYV